MKLFSRQNKKTIHRRQAGIVAILFMAMALSSCNKLVQIPEPINTITASETFSSESTANSAIAGIYFEITAGGIPTAIATYCGMSADELKPYGGQSFNPVFNNNLLPTSGAPQEIWTDLYNFIYRANAAIEGLQSYAPESEWKTRLISEAEFLRAYSNFYLVNIYGDVPLATTSAWAKTAVLPRSVSADIYKQIIEDLKDAKNNLLTDYSVSAGERTRANKWAASALLARAYLYSGNFPDAESESSSLISNSSLFSLETDLNNVFLKNSPEAIWQYQTIDPATNATSDGQQFIPYPDSPPDYYCAEGLISDFEPDDKRLQFWIGNTTVDGNTYYYPFKYKVKKTTPDNITEYSFALRLSEQYLIRAEARARQDNQAGAAEDINVIRTRAGLPELAASLSKDQLLDAIAHERRVELFTEGCNRWFDLKRTGTADAKLAPIKHLWKPTAKLYPIPYSEIQLNPSLTQNAGY